MFQKFQCHKVVLARASKKFADLLFGPEANVTSDIKLDNVPPKIFQYLLE